MKKWLFIFAHMDDETIACFDLIKQHDSSIMICTNGSSKTCEGRLHTFYDLWAELPVEILNNNDESLHLVSPAELAEKIKKFVLRIEPSVVVTHYSKDLHYEHQIVSQAVKVAARRINSIEQIYEAFIPDSSLYLEDAFPSSHKVQDIITKEAYLQKYRELGYQIARASDVEKLRLVYEIL